MPNSYRPVTSFKCPLISYRQPRCLSKRKRLSSDWSNEIVIRMRGTFDLRRNNGKNNQLANDVNDKNNHNDVIQSKPHDVIDSESPQSTSEEIQGFNF